MIQQLPITSDPNQSFQSTLSIDGDNVTLGFKFDWNEITNYWIMNILDQNDNVILGSIALIPSVNLLEQFSYMKIGSAFIVNVSNTPDEYPTKDNLGSDFILCWGDTI